MGISEKNQGFDIKNKKEAETNENGSAGFWHLRSR